MKRNLPHARLNKLSRAIEPRDAWNADHAGHVDQRICSRTGPHRH